ncbi:unnamed protein product, partial [Rotaria magnacalcarata]
MNQPNRSKILGTSLSLVLGRIIFFILGGILLFVNEEFYDSEGT